MRVAVVGSRNYANLGQVQEYIQSLPKHATVISGGARGVDKAAENEAFRQGLAVHIYPAKWDEFGKSAGILRNADIVAASEIVVAFWDGRSRGTKDTIERALKAKHIQRVVVYKREGNEG